MIDNRTDNYVFAAPAYANAAPLAHFIEQVSPGLRVVYDRPSQLIGQLAAGEVDVALIPVVDSFFEPRLATIEGLGICADGDVWSVLLKCNRPLEEVRRVARDPASRTSNALAEVLLDHHFGLSVRMIDCEPGDRADAEVVIGDRALSAAPGPCGDYDLAGQWKAMTGLPFVFAVWAHRADHPDPAGLGRIVAGARDAGARGIGELAAIRAPQIAISVERCREYLASVVHYDVGPRETEAMRLFERMLDERSAQTTSGQGGKGQ